MKKIIVLYTELKKYIDYKRDLDDFEVTVKKLKRKPSPC